MMPSDNLYERLSQRLEEYVQRAVPRLAERLRGGPEPPFTIKLSEREQAQRLATISPAELQAMMEGLNSEELLRFQRQVEHLLRTQGG